jgi:hypothetical protein
VSSSKIAHFDVLYCIEDVTDYEGCWLNALARDRGRRRGAMTEKMGSLLFDGWLALHFRLSLRVRGTAKDFRADTLELTLQYSNR